MSNPAAQTNTELSLDEPVEIHFKENSIPGLRRGVLTAESKQRLATLIEQKQREAVKANNELHKLHQENLEAVIAEAEHRSINGFSDCLKLAMIDGKSSHSVARIHEIIESERLAALKKEAIQ